jgi:hypothetical protein
MAGPEGRTMAALRGTVQGSRGEASRLAARTITTTAQTWTARITVRLDADGTAVIEVADWQRGGTPIEVFRGDVHALVADGQ